MKKNFVIFIIIVLIISSILTWYVIDLRTKEKTIVSMVIKEGTLTNTRATIIITDLSNDDNTYGAWFRIDKKVNEKWKEAPRLTDNDDWNLIGYHVDENNKLELEEDWSYIYGELEPGEYRIVKDYLGKNEIRGNYVYAEFTIQ